MTSEPSGRLYSAVTKYWPRIAVGLVVVAAAGDLVIGGLTADSRFEFYVTAWAAITGGLWFLFEKAEKALSEEARSRVANWIGEVDVGGSIESIPAQFGLLFDRVFGERHWSRACFNRSCLASVLSVVVVWCLMLGAGSYPQGFLARETFMAEDVPGWALVAIWGVGGVGMMVPFNFFPDYLSLLETRWAIRWMRDSGRTVLVLVVDLLMTSVISFFIMVGMLAALTAVADVFVYFIEGPEAVNLLYYRDLIPGMAMSLVGSSPGDEMTFFVRVGFLSAFFTSVWLWLYAASVPLSRVLLRMNSGVGFLLRATDVERQPFRSMGFVSVIIVSVLFAMGLPLVLL